MKKRDCGVNEERIRREGESEEAISGLVEKRASENKEKMRAAIEDYVERNIGKPKKQSREEETPNLAKTTHNHIIIMIIAFFALSFLRCCEITHCYYIREALRTMF